MGRRVTAPKIESHVRRARGEAGLTQQELAARVGLTRQSISAIESGQYVPNTTVALRLASVLDCSVEQLFHLPIESGQVKADLVGGVLGGGRPTRVRLARVGDRMVAHPLHGATSIFSSADGMIRDPGSAETPAQAVVDLLVDRRIVERTVVISGCDPAMGLLGSHLSRAFPDFRILWVPAGSSAALRSLGRGECHVAGSHLRDSTTGEFNVPHVQRELPGRRLSVITLSTWQAGLIVARGNPKAIDGFADLARPDVAIVNREGGAGSRVFLDDGLGNAGVAPDSVHGYGHEVSSHLAVAEAIASGEADAGPGILAAARAFDLDFVPLQEERFDLVVPAEFLDTAPIQALLETATGASYRAEVETLGGYDSSPAGNIVADLAV